MSTGRVKAVVFDYGHTIVDFRRTEEALLDAYRRIRERIEAALEIEAPEVGHLIDRVANTAQERDIRVALSNSFGFGGTNASLIMKAV